MGLKIVKKKEKDPIDSSELNGAYAWDCQWKLDDLPRRIRSNKNTGEWK